MKPMLALLIMAIAASAWARDERDRDRCSRIRYTEGGVTLQRSDESASEEAEPNLPFLPGDRLWTDGRGRVELQFDDGSVVRLDSAGKLDFAGTGQRGEVALRLWSGSLYIHVGRRADSFELETPGGLVLPLDEGIYRIDVDADEIRVSVYEGSASLDSGRRRITIDDGERAYSRRGEQPDGPHGFDTREADEFARWDAERQDRLAWNGDSLRYLPEEVEPYAGELEEYGSWYFDAEVGNVWRPHVSIGWRPYTHGRWIWTYYGWTWIPEEPWGWSTFHYGRWGYSWTLGWYWIPGNVWGPAWVSWAVGPDHIGWCPLGRHDRPAHYDSRYRGRAVPRGTAPPTDPPGSESGAWTFARRGDLIARDLARRRIDTTPAQLANVRVMESVDFHPSRDLKTVESRTAAHERATIKTRPTLGEWVPELRSNPSTTIPFAWPRAPQTTRDDRSQTVRSFGSPSDQSLRNRTERATPDSSVPWWRERATSRPPETRETESLRPRSNDTGRTFRTAPEWQRSRESQSSSVSTSTGSAAKRLREAESSRWSTERERSSSRSRSNDGVPDVVRRFFQPVTESHGDRSGNVSRGSSRIEPRASDSKSAPRPVFPRIQSDRGRSSSSSAAHAKPTEKKKN